MLDFLLVLGQVPGTNIQITFSEIVIGVALVGVLFYGFKNRRKFLKRNLDLKFIFHRHNRLPVQLKLFQ